MAQDVEIRMYHEVSNTERILKIFKLGAHQLQPDIIRLESLISVKFGCDSLRYM